VNGDASRQIAGDAAALFLTGRRRRAVVLLRARMKARTAAAIPSFGVLTRPDQTAVTTPPNYWNNNASENDTQYSLEWN
jgi:hypothetical protein